MSAKSSALPISPLTAFVAAAAVVVGTLAFRHWRRQHHGHGHGHGHAHSHGGAVPAAGSDVNAREADGDARFSALAETYDSNPSLKFVNSKIVEALTSKLPFPLDAKATDVLEFGCGTGAVSMAIRSHVRSVVALDAAEGMIAEVNRKIKAANGTADNVTAVCKRLDAPEDLPLFGGAATHTDRFDVIFTTLAFHHLSDPARVMTLFRALLRPGGVVVVADLIANDTTRQMMANAVKAGHGGGHAHGGGAGGHDGHAHSHGGGHGHSHGGGHGHSHGGGHGHSHGGGSDAKGDDADGKPTDVFHTGFDPNQFRKLPGHCGLTLVSMDAPYFQVDMFDSRVDMFLAVASKPKPTPNADVKAKDA